MVNPQIFNFPSQLFLMVYYSTTLLLKKSHMYVSDDIENHNDCAFINMSIKHCTKLQS